MKKVLILAAFAMIGFSGIAHADTEVGPKRGGFYIEPGALYAFKGDGKFKEPTGSNPLGEADGDQSGFGGELRVGAHIHNIFFAGLEGTYLRDKLDAQGYDTTGNEWNVGVFGGLQMPWIVGLRVWGSYLPYGEYSFDSNQNFKYKFTDAQGFKVGAGFRVSVISLNFEYMRLSYHGSNSNSGNASFDSTKEPYQHDAYMVGVSFPFDL